MPDIGSLLDRLQGVFGRGFVVAGVIPILIATGVSGAIGYNEVVTVRDAVVWLVGLTGWQLALATGFLTFAVSIVGFAYWSLNPWLRGLLEGQSALLPAPLRRELRRRQQGRLLELESRLATVRSEYLDYQQLAPDPTDPRSSKPPAWRAELNAAATTGNAKPSPAQLSAATKKEASRLEAMRIGLRPIPAARLSAYIVLLATDRASGTQNSQVNNLIFQANITLVPYAKAMAEIQFFKVLSDRREHFPLDLASIGSSAFGNLSEIEREYASTRYGIDSNLFGAHFLKVAAADKDFTTLLDDAKLRVDFAVAMTVMFAALTLTWLIIIAVGGRAVLPALVVAVVGPLITLAFYETSVASQRGMLSMARALIDLFRFDVLKTLHLPMPSDDEVERRAWEEMAARAQHTSASHMTYDHT